MSKSTKLSTAAHILMYLSWNKGERVHIEDIAKSANTNPSRLRQLCSILSQSGFIKTYKGAHGGIEAAIPPENISLFDLCVCLQDTNFFALVPHDASVKCPVGKTVQPTMSKLYSNYNNIFTEYLKATSIFDLIEMSNGLKDCSDLSAIA